jgi:hypothetical protein
MGKDWIEQSVESKRAREAEASKKAEIELHKARNVKAKGPDMAKRLLAAIQVAVDRYRQLDSDTPITCYGLPNPGMIVKKETLPTVALTCIFDSQANAIKCKQITLRSPMYDSATNEFSVGMESDVSGNVYFVVDGRRVNDTDEVVEFLLKPVFS